jgi:hypothetical protein
MKLPGGITNISGHSGQSLNDLFASAGAASLVCIRVGSSASAEIAVTALRKFAMMQKIRLIVRLL